jgi:DNA-binding transcriptional LysR family regulator
MRLFVGVAQRKSFSACAREMRLSPAAVTKHIAALEAQLGTRLLDRTTRQVAMTASGRVYFERCLACLQAFDDAQASVTDLEKEPRGSLRLTAPVDFPQIGELVARFMREYSSVVLDVQLSNRSVSLVEEGIDLAIRCAPALDGQFVARPVAKVSMMLWGSKDYLRRHGHPRHPRELKNHRVFMFVERRPVSSFTLQRGDETIVLTLEPAMTSNSGALILSAVREGLGLAWAPSFMTHADAVSGRVEPTLLEWTLPAWKLFAVYPHRRFLSPTVRAFVELMCNAYGDGTRDPWLLEPKPTARRRSRR